MGGKGSGRKKGSDNIGTDRKNNGFYKRWKICEQLGMLEGGSWFRYREYIKELYLKGLSGVEISELILRQTGVEMAPRSIQRTLREMGVMRDKKTAFRNAMTRGRVMWQLDEDKKRRAIAKEQIPRKKRFEILERDGFRCRLCGNGSEQDALLQVDHIIAKVNGGTDDDSNLRTLCIDCNIGKARAKKERRRGGGFKRLEEAKPLP